LSLESEGPKESTPRNQWRKGIVLAPADNTLYRTYRDNHGFEKLALFVASRYFAIETRVHETFRFVDLEPRNASTFSYEYASLLRDIGGAFDSALKAFCRNVTGIKNPTIHNHLDFLRQNIRSSKPGELADLTTISVELASDRTDRFLYPFADLCTDSPKSNLPKWWDAYNDVKHLEIEKFVEGNFKNVLNAFAALFVLFILTDKDEGRGHSYKVFVGAKFAQMPMEWDRQLSWFFKGS